MQKSLAIQLQEVTQELRLHQRNLMTYMEDFKKKGVSKHSHFEFNLNTNTIPILNDQNQVR